MRYLTLEEILILHNHQIETYGGGPGIRDINLLESAVFRPQTSFYGTELYKTVYEKAAILGQAIIQNHGFVDGNKRTGIYAMLVTLELNGIQVNLTTNAIVLLALEIANKSVDIKDIVTLLKRHTI